MRTRSLSRVAIVLGCAIGCLSCGGSRDQAYAAADPANADQARLWSEAEGVWTRYVQHLQKAEGASAVRLAAEPGLAPFSRFRVAALVLEREHLLQLRPEDSVLVLQLRAISTASDLDQMSDSDVFVALADAGALGDALEPSVRIGRQREDTLFLRSGETWLGSPTFVVTADGPRVLSSTVQAEKRLKFRRRMGLSTNEVPKLPAEDLLNEAARVLGRSPDPTWWNPLRPISETYRREALERLEPDDSKRDESSKDEEPVKKPALGRLEPRIVQRKVRQQFDTMRVCYEDGLARDPNLEGKVLVRFVIQRDGFVAAERHTSESLFEDVADCIGTQFMTLQFPEPEGGTVAVTYPIMFSPG